VNHSSTRIAYDAPAPVSIPVAVQRGGMSALQGYYLVLRGLARPQRITWPERPHTWEGEFEITPAMRRDWMDLFGAANPAREIPFSYHSPLSVRMGHEALRVLGVNFKNILYLKSELDVARADVTALTPGKTYRLRVTPERIAPCRRRAGASPGARGDRAILTLEATVTDTRGARLMTVRDSMLLKNVSPRDMDAIARTGTLAVPAPSDVPAPQRLARDESRIFLLPFAEDTGRRYGELSGDTNFLHTNPYLLKIFGYERMFAHGMCTANHVMKSLCGDLGIPLRGFRIDFRRPVFLGQTVELRVGEDRFEVCDAEDRVLASGGYRAFADRRAAGA
jgi:hypothetical protein